MKEFIFTDDRPFLSCHASTVLPLDNGEVLAAWFGGTHEKHSDVAIWLSRRDQKGWSVPIRIADEENIAHWNPVLFTNQEGAIFLVYKVGHEIVDWFSRVMISKDQGSSWSEPVELVPGDIGGRGPVRNKTILLGDGNLLAPASIERRDPSAPGKEIWEAFVDISSDHGATWTPSALVPMRIEEYVGQHYFNAKGMIQPTLWQSGSGQVHMLLRSTEGFIYRSDSNDGGETWCEAYPIDVPNNNSGIDLAQLNDGTLLLVCTPLSGYGTSSLRTPLVIMRSTDNGDSWKQVYVLESEPGEYSYPAIAAEGSRVHITYTWRRERIAYWALNVSELHDNKALSD